MIKLMLVDDHAIIREGMKMLLSNNNSLSIVGEAGSVKELKEKASLLHSIDVLVLDMFLESEDAGLNLLQTLLKDVTSLKVLVVSMFTSSLLIQECLTYGAKGYVTKSEATEYLEKAILTVYDNKTFLSPSVLSILLENPLKAPDTERNPSLTNREKDVLNLLGRGYSTRRICNQLSISASTVGTHIENIKAKLGIDDKNSLLRYAIECEQQREKRERFFSKND